MGFKMTTPGHLCIDLGTIEMSADHQRELISAVQATVVAFLAKLSENYKVVTITMGTNNGMDQTTPPPDAAT